LAKHILLVDDEAAILDVCERYLKREGYRVTTGMDGQEALRLWRQYDFDVIILDVMMPYVDGWEVCEEIRKSHDIPIVFLTSKGEEHDKLIGLTIGANDYMTKPFNPRELVLRVNAICRLLDYQHHSQAEQNGSVSSIIHFDPLFMNAATREVSLNDKRVELTVKEFDLLWLLASQPKRVFSRSQLLHQVWQTEFDDDTTTVTVHIRRLREKIEQTPSSPNFIQTVWGIGYKFIPPGGEPS
jgi:two-component system, OmpR family, response regulator VicR